MDPQLYMEGLKHKRIEYPHELRRQLLQVEFSHFLKSYMLSKQSLHEGHLLDAYSAVLEAISHWARIVIIEDGTQLDGMVMPQVRKINPEVYKLYEKLNSNDETLEQRVKLVILACDFSMMSKMESCCSIVLDVIRSREEPWSLKELAEEQSLKELDLELQLIIQKLSRKQLIREVAVSNDDSLMLELKFTLC